MRYRLSYLGAPRSYPGAPKSYPGAPKSHPGALKSYPGAPRSLVLCFLSDERRCDVDDISHTSVIAGSFRSVDRDYDGYYDHYIHCFWELKLASFKTNEVIEICLYDVDIPSNDNCSSDHIKVR